MNQPNQLPMVKQDKRLRMEEAIKRKRLMRILTALGIVALGTILIGGGIWYEKWREKNLPGVSYPEVGREHIAFGEPLPKPYNSNPPSSGAHFPSPANWGVYDYEVPDLLFIHNLEHGGVWIAYRPTVPSAVVDELKGIVNEFSGSKIVMAPRSQNDADVAMVAWTRVMKFNLTGGNLTDSQKNDIRRFYKAFKNHGPEFVPDTMPGVDPKEVIKK